MIQSSKPTAAFFSTRAHIGRIRFYDETNSDTVLGNNDGKLSSTLEETGICEEILKTVFRNYYHIDNVQYIVRSIRWCRNDYSDLTLKSFERRLAINPNIEK